jgi:UTP-glucose-1-phosphate uridylyltransferase
MSSFTLTLKPGQSVRKAVIPLAGYGTRIFPATKAMKKGFAPVVDKDGMLKPALFIMLEELFDAGIEDVCLIIGEDEQDEYDRLFAPVSEELKSKLPNDKAEYADRIVEMRQHITFVYQNERRGFGHAVHLTKQFAGGSPVLLLLGDFIYESLSPVSCSRQVIDAYMECGKTLVSVEEVDLERVVHYGILFGQWDDTEETMMKVERMVEKPTDDYAEEYLGVINSRKQKKYYATFGQYVLTPEVYDELTAMVVTADNEGLEDEIGLTEALDNVRNKYGMYAFRPEGKSYDLGLPEAYRFTIANFGASGDLKY